MNRVTNSQSTWTLMAWNIAKCDFHQGGLNFRSEEDVRGHLDKLAAVILEQDVDILFLSEAVFEAF
ncbi:MAG: hypothetical protein P1V35_13640, partial [Planctomycetota bacterium]|nr:hypothetical protein [Planctomycetota bacterium]